MHISHFKKGDIITRNEPMVYDTGIKDYSYCGDQLEFVAFHPESKIMAYKHIDNAFFGDDVCTLSVARPTVADGWTLFPKFDEPKG